LQASNFTAFFEHVMAPGATLERFSNDLSDLKVLRMCEHVWERIRNAS
jgi:hypothetical protein